MPDAELEYDSELVYRHHETRFTGVGYEQTPAMRSEMTKLTGSNRDRRAVVAYTAITVAAVAGALSMVDRRR